MHAHHANASPAMNNSYNDYNQAGNENSFSVDSLSQSCNTQGNNNDNAKLWDNDELVMKALRVYGKMPRPQVFNEISRVCKLSNLRKSRYFHEKMMKNNPFKDKIMQIIKEEGEHNYPYFKIFFEEYKTKKQRLSLINNENVESLNVNAVNGNFAQKKENSNPLMIPKLDHSVENSVENSNDYENSCSDQVYYNNDEICTENYDYNPEDYDNAEITGMDEEQYAQNQTDYDVTENLDYGTGNHADNYNNQNNDNHNQITPLVESNNTYLENLELKLKILNKEKEHMVDYFKTFTTVVDNLKAEIDSARNGEDGMKDDDQSFKFDKGNINSESLDCLSEQLTELSGYIMKLKTDTSKFGRDQAALREELKVTRHYANVENLKLQDEVNACKAQLSSKDEEIRSLKTRLEDSMRHNRTATAKHLSLQNNANLSKSKLGELKESMDRMFAQIQSLSS